MKQLNQLKLAFTGEAGCGKDYVMDILQEEYNFHRISFSDQLKKLAVKIYPWMAKDYPSETKELALNIQLENEIITKSPREIWLSLNKLRDVEDGLFVRMLEDEMNLLRIDNIVISDIRTQNEWDWCKDNDFTTVYIHNENSPHKKNDFDDFSRSLENETDYHLTNDMDGPDFVRNFMTSCIIPLQTS